MSNVFVLDTNKHPLHPVHPAWARKLLSTGQAAVFRRYPFTIILKREVVHLQGEPLRLKIDPGSNTTGLAIVSDATGKVVWAADCSARDVPLQIDHILCRARGGTDRASNLTLACQSCNVKKNAQLVGDFLKEKPEVLARILAQATVPLKDAAAVNATRWELYQRLHVLGLPVEWGTGGRTKYNRASLDLPKAHWIDAACVGASTPKHLCTTGITPVLITANGHGSRQMCRMDKHGFPRTGPKQARRVKGFQTGDLVRAVVTAGYKVGTYVGRVAVRTTGSFNITTRQGTVQGISHRFCTLVHRSDGYSYQAGEAA